MNSMPYSIEAEESLLGAMLQNNQAISIALSKINSKDFYNERNKILYESIIELHNRLGNKEDVKNPSVSANTSSTKQNETKKKSPKTGDTTPIVSSFAMMGAGLLSMIGLLRKKEHK